MKTVQSILVLLCISMGISSCSDKNSLHNYILNNAEKVGFSSNTIPVSTIREQEGLQLTNEQNEAFDAIERVNVLIYQVNKTKKEEFATEKAKVRSILKQPKYEELIDLGTKGVIKFTGEEDEIDEIVIFLSNKEMGFALARIVGDDMTMNKFMELYKITAQQGSSGINLNSLTNFISLN